MADAPTDDARARSGKKDDRKPEPIKSSQTAGYSYGIGLVTATFHYLVKCRVGGHWVWITPEDALIEMWAFAIVPFFALIYIIAIKRLKTLAGEQQ